MIEYQFRAWNTKYECMMKPDVIDLKNNRIKCDSEWYEGDDFILMQGLNEVDKNKKPIYVGDICIVRDSSVDEEDGLFIIDFTRDTLQYVLSSNELILDFDNTYAKNIEIVGNVYENPELLNEKEIEEELE